MTIGKPYALRGGGYNEGIIKIRSSLVDRGAEG
jgi:hypothetical protein